MKYKLRTDLSAYIGFRKLYRIEALKDFSYIEKGHIGGYVESEENLSQDNNCWVFDDAQVYGNAQLFDNAQLFGNTKLYGNAQVYGNAQLFGYAQVYGNAKIYGNAKLYDNTKVYGNAQVFDIAFVYDNVKICNDTKLYGNAWVYGNTILKGYDEINDKGQVFNIIGFRYPITVTSHSVHIGCKDFTFDELDKDIQNTLLNKEEKESINTIVKVLLNQILINLEKE
jgi:hypothetical protein